MSCGNNANVTVTNTRGSFNDNNWGFTNFSSGANIIISQATPVNSSAGTISSSTPYGYDASSSSGQTKFMQFTQTASGNVTFNTALYPYNGSSAGIRTIKLDTRVQDNVASAMRIQFFDSPTLTNYVDEITYYNSFETASATHSAIRRIDSDNCAVMFSANAGNAYYHNTKAETVDEMYLSGGKSLEIYKTVNSDGTGAKTILARLVTSEKVTDLSAKWNAQTNTIEIESSDKKIISGTVGFNVVFNQIGSASVQNVTINGETVKGREFYNISQNGVNYSHHSLFFDLKMTLRQRKDIRRKCTQTVTTTLIQAVGP